MPSEQYARLEQQTNLRCPVEIGTEREAGSTMAEANVRSFAAGEEYSVLIGRGDRQRPGVAARAIQKVWRAGGETAGGTDVFPAPRKLPLIVQRIAKENRAAPRGRAMRETQSGIRRNASILKVRADRPWSERPGINRIEDVPVVLGERSSKACVTRLSRVSASHECKTVGTVDGVCGRSGYPVQSV